MAHESHIFLLPDHVANKIAAGEVVERPASVIKELTENAIDAGATRIDVEIAAGGRKLISVSDNGSGMNRDDALLCIERHATSKIRDVDDIEQIGTLGFRGEAMAAIASVCRFRLVTCTHDEEVGTEILISAGKLRDVRDIGAPGGTLIECRDLFFNVPARRKFMRTAQTELTHVRTAFIVQALAHPQIAMSLTIDGREAYRLVGSPARSNELSRDQEMDALRARLADLFGADYVANLRPVDHQQSGVTVWGYSGLPAISRTDRNEQYVFVNGRATSAPVIGYALREGYHTLLTRDRNPSVFLCIDLDCTLVDVNVHPTKREVRFRRPSDVRDAVITAIHDALSTPPDGATALAPEIDEVPNEGPPQASSEAQLQIEDLPPPRAFRYPKMPLASGGEAPPPTPRPEVAPADAAPNGAPWTWCRVLGQIGTLYVVLEIEDGYVLMDPHAAHERVLYEKFMKQVVDGSVHTQKLLIPETVELQPADAQRVRKGLKLLASMGFGIAEFGGDTFVMDAVPGTFAGVSAQAFLVAAARNLEHAGSRGGKGRWQEDAIATAACKAAVKAHDKLTLREIEQLVIDLAQAEMPYTCPHGRPTLIFTSFRDLNRKFGRE